jgi:Predicted sugar phosphate isomerase involved in capsule formation
MMDNFQYRYRNTVSLVISEINGALSSVDVESIERLVEDLYKAEKVFLIGVGRVMLSLEAFSKRLSHLGIHAHCVGDITEPALTDKDIIVVASGSGESIVPVAVAKKAKELKAKRIIHIGSNPNGSMKEFADYMVRIPVRTRLYLKDEIVSEQIMTSLFEQTLLILGDIISKIIVDEKKIDLKDLWQYHANLE